MDKAWLGFAWSMGIWHRNINPETLHVSMGGVFQVSSCPSIETYVEQLVETWHISMGGRFRVFPCLSIETCDGGPRKLPCFGWWLCLEAPCFWVSKLILNCHQNMICFVVSLLKGLTLPTHRIVENKWHIYDLSVK